jgi:hypothetical protein
MIITMLQNSFLLLDIDYRNLAYQFGTATSGRKIQYIQIQYIQM